MFVKWADLRRPMFVKRVYWVYLEGILGIFGPIVMMDVDQLVSIHYSLWLKLINLSHSIEVIRIE